MSADKERKKEYHRKYYAKHKERIAEQRRKYRIENKERIRERQQKILSQKKADRDVIMSEIEIELKPCPFCGGKLIYIRHIAGGNRVICRTCGAMGGMGEVKDDAVEAWNERG